MLKNLPAPWSIWDCWTSLGNTVHYCSAWWFGPFFTFPYIGNGHPNWLIFFRWGKTTNQIYMCVKLNGDDWWFLMIEETPKIIWDLGFVWWSRGFLCLCIHLQNRILYTHMLIYVYIYIYIDIHMWHRPMKETIATQLPSRTQSYFSYVFVL